MEKKACFWSIMSNNGQAAFLYSHHDGFSWINLNPAFSHIWSFLEIVIQDLDFFFFFNFHG